jgi:hypothetical protein
MCLCLNLQHQCVDDVDALASLAGYAYAAIMRDADPPNSARIQTAINWCERTAPVERLGQLHASGGAAPTEQVKKHEQYASMNRCKPECQVGTIGSEDT